ncbi:MAG: hypothetical protein DMF57_15615, partial [Acidobacteria bacterium]
MGPEPYCRRSQAGSGTFIDGRRDHRCRRYLGLKRAVLIVAGGIGTRLRPLSSDENPKQFLRIFGGQSLLQKTFARATRLAPPESIYISTSEEFRQKCIEHLPQLPLSNILTEPV